MKTIIFLFSSLLMLTTYTSCNVAGAISDNQQVQPHEVTPGGLSWYSIDDLEKLNTSGKRVMIDMYTSWCGWCKVMDRKTFSDPGVIDYLNKNFVLIKFNAEQRAPITFQGEQYEFMNVGRRGVNKLALKLMNGRMGYPTMVYLDSNLTPIKSSPGYKTPEQLLSELEVL